MTGAPFGEEGYSLLADEEGPEAAEAAVEYVREQRRMRGEPTMSRKEAVWRATSYLDRRDPPVFIESYSATPDGSRNLWAVDCIDTDQSQRTLEVAADGEVREIGQALAT